MDDQKKKRKVVNNLDVNNITINSNDDIVKIKNDIGKIIPNDIKINAKNDSQKKLINSIKNNEITICAGQAGSGKTFVALAYALSLLRKNNNRFKKIYLIKSVTTLKNEDLGFLKGDLINKFDPYMSSYYINIEKIISETALNTLIEKNIIRPFPLAYIKGASLDDCIIISDETQNVTFENSRIIMTRIGSNAKLIMLGDINQIDLKNKKESSLEFLLTMFKNIDNIGVIEMDDNDINVRNPIIGIIENKYNEFKNK